MTTDRPLDMWRERMVAALYGEVSAGEQAELQAAMERDAGLRRDFEELTEARTALRRLLDSAEDADEEPAKPGWSALRRRPAPGRRRPWRPVLAASVGFAVAASLFVGLLFAGLRVDRTPGGVVVRLDRDAESVTQAPIPYVTRDELAAVAELLAAGTASRLDQLERRQAAVQAEVAKTLYDALAVTQQRQFHDLRNRIELAAYRPLQGPARPSSRR